jgi:hypothetical protein
MHRHGSYERYDEPKGTEKFRVQRFLCPPCGHTVSVLPPKRLTYRPLAVKQLQAHFDAQAEVSSRLDPPPDAVTAGCLQRAWNRFLTRVAVLKNAFGQMLPAVISSPSHLWQQLRQCVGTAEEILRFLAQHGKRSLLGDYVCLRPAP